MDPGVGRAFVDELARIAVSRGCYGMWVATSPDNAPALHTYRSSGSDEGEVSVVLSWGFAAADTDPGRI